MGVHRSRALLVVAESVARAGALGAALALVLVLAPARARAQDPLTANDFSIDVFTGPALSSGRIVGLGGAYAGIADGIDGVPLNPASYAARAIYELSSFEWELSFGFLLPGAFAANDFDNNGETGFTTKDFLFLTLGLRLQFDNVGFGVLSRLQTFRVDNGGPAVDVSLIIENTGVGYQLFGGQLVLGAGLRTAILDVQNVGSSASLVELTGTGPEVGALWRPVGQPFRIGVSARTPVFSVAQAPADSGTVRTVEGFVLPKDVHMPWEVGLGVAVQLGGRPLNLAWHDPTADDEHIETHTLVRRALRTRAQVEREMARERASGQPAAVDDARLGPVVARGPTDPAWLQAEAVRREREDEELDDALDAADLARDEAIESLSRLYLLISAEALLTGPTRDGVGLESFLAQIRDRSGERMSLGARLGLEGEPWPGRIKLRLGTYLEPSRFEGHGYRVHGTAGLDLKLFRWDVFGLFDPFDIRVGAVMDLASRYFDWGVGVGIWH